VKTKGGLKDEAWVEIDQVPAPSLAAKWCYSLCKQLHLERPHYQSLQRANAKGYRDHRGFQVHAESFFP
jgi:hypothetical protein